MKSQTYASMILAGIAVMFAVATKLTSPILGVGPDGFLDGASLFLLFGVNFALLEILNKK